MRESVRPRIPAQGHERILNESSRPSVSDVPSDVKIIYEDNDGIVVCRPSHVEPNKEHRESVTDETKAGSSIAKCAKTGDKTNLYSCSDEHPSDENIQNKIEVAADLVRSNQSGPSQKSEIVSGSRRNIQEGCLRSRLGSYADILRTVVMQQIIDSGGSVNSVELEDVEDDMYGDEIAFDGNEDDCDEEYVNGFSVEALAQAAVALHRQSSGGSTESNRDLKLSWKQVVRGEAGRLIDDRGFHISNSTADQGNGKCNRNWDDEFVLRHQLSALIPAFDPRPGRTNVNQIQEVELPQSRESLIEMAGPSCSPVQLVKAEEPKLRLYLRGPNLTSINNITIELDRDDKSIFYYLQQLVQSIEWGQKNDRTRRIWEPTYTLIYGDMSDSNELPITMNKSVEENNRIPENIVRTLSVISRLYQIAANISEYEISSDIFVSEKLTLKLLQELSDPLIVSSRALPSWCDELIFNHPCLFAVETRINYFRATAFGASRSIVWLQTRRDQMLERSRGSAATVPLSSLASTRRDDHYPEFRLGRIKHERIKVPRSDEHLFEYAVRLMQFHASRKAILEIEYINEEGTGLGPTLEFYALVCIYAFLYDSLALFSTSHTPIAAEFQRKNLAMWICDDIDTDETMEIDLGKGIKPPGYYVRRSGGLFPAPLPVSSAENSRVSELFRILGIFLAKVLQDGRLVDLPLSQPFLKLMTSSQIAEEEMDLNGVLDLSDLENISPNQGYILKKLAEYVERRKSLSNYDGQNIHIPHQKDKQSMLCISGVECSIEDLSLTFCINPSSTVFNYKEMELIENGANIDVNADNVEQYIAAYTDFYLNSGIVNQIKAFREGFDLVFPLRNLRMFTPKELQSLLCGEQCPQWTREDIINFTEPKLGYTKDSPGFLRFVDVLVGMNASERKSFLQFTTGCSSLPPGGLANLHPRLTVVRKVDSGDGSYPSVNTCVHYLKLPDYTSTEIMRERLITATNEKGFHLN
ncbi:unnamed protein product [Thelazia callipaeda]|uniref:E3 ubiquitin-protein ligase n=1 Tax=Thelazia callipaeda TaxID=103827 RepID=A0A3P7KMT3_THECL|nr:unnamed protein product [Thelazia callipaeda]